MTTGTIKNGYYVKLGRGGEWVESSFKEGKVRIGWPELSLDDIYRWDEADIRKKGQLARERQGLPFGKREVSNDVGALRKIVHSTSEEVWITFDGPYLWWCRVADTPMEEDAISKYRKVTQKWSNCSLGGGRLIANQIPGRLSKIQRFSGTICSLGKDEVADLERLLNGEVSPEHQSIEDAKAALINHVASGLSLLHWKDFELLVDLVFRNAGWRRTTVVGESMKYVDMELEEPITHDRYQVQVKSDATIANFEQCAKGFAQGDFKKLYYVVHSPKAKWVNAPKYKHVELVAQEDLAEMVVDMGLVDWLLKKIR
jgi:hypothetical protein